MTNETGDEVLMQRIVRGDTAAFDLLFQRHQRSVYHFTLQMTADSALAEDLTQECFLRVWRARASYRPGAALRTYLFTIARRLVLDAAKQPCARFPPASATGDVADRYDPQTILMGHELERVLDTALTELPEALRETVVLRDIEGLRYDEIAEITGCPLGTVKSRLAAARQRLKVTARQWLEEE